MELARGLPWRGNRLKRPRASFRQVVQSISVPHDDNAVSWERAMIVLGIGAIAIAIITLASFTLLLHSGDTKPRLTRIF